ncbi:MAG TPA: glycosyl hydrolase [Candidatus Eisenbacteria bacterium]|nr:glycosyl hydrolase [Candidatus Eisenbacteria bacterium]
MRSFRCGVTSVLTVLTFVLVFAVAASAQQIDPKTYGGMKWRLIGPFRGGRVVAVTGMPSQPNTYYFGAVAGGVWKTTDGGLTWDPLFEKQPVSSIGAIAEADSDSNVIYVGTGEACIRGNISFGDGVYKSTDAGKTWTNVGLKDTRHIGAIIIHPTNPDVVFVAALGHAYGPNSVRGVFRTRDGGRTWERVLYLDDRTGAIDVVFDPQNPHILFAAMWEGWRTPWTLNSGGAKDGLYRSNDDGTTWKRLEGEGLPEGPLGRIGVSVSNADSNVVYALIEAKKGGLYRSDDGGAKWSLINDDHRFRQRAWYFTHVWADPKDSHRVYIANTGLYRSLDGGKTFERLHAPHGDHHALWIDPNDPNRMINGNDGGATISVDGGKNWSSDNNQPTAQFYHVAADNDFLYRVYGSQQDSFSLGIRTRSDRGFIDRGDWDHVGGGESGYIVPDPRDSNIVYADDEGPIFTRFDRRTNQAQSIQEWPEDPAGYSAATQKYRYTWTMPIVISSHNPDVIYHTSQYVFRSNDAGRTWSTISPDLTRNDKSKQQDSGGPITKDQLTVEYYDTVFTLAESPKQEGLLWAGTDDGLIQLTRDGGKTWANVTPKEVPEWAMISLIEASPFEAGTAYAAVDAHKLDNFKPYIFTTRDFGKTWTKIIAGLPDNSYVHAVREDPTREGLLYVGTETGIWVSFNDGMNWQPLQLNLPSTPIHDMVVHDDDLVVATHGRSFWVLDDISPLRQASTSIAAENTHLFAPRTAWRTRFGYLNDAGEISTSAYRRRFAIAENPPAGAILYYYLKEEQKQPAKLEILDAQGNVIRGFNSEEKRTEEGAADWDRDAPEEHIPANTGLNLFSWDLRYERPTKIPQAVYDLYEPIGPLALPGTYQVRLTVGGKAHTASFEVKMDPRVRTSAEDLRKQFDLILKIRDRTDEMNKAIIAIRDLREQLKALEKRLGASKSDASGPPNLVVAASTDLRKKIAAIEEELIQVNGKSSEDSANYPTKLESKFAYLQNVTDSADTAPTGAELAVFAELDERLETQLAKWREVLAKDVPALNEAMRKNNVPSVAPGATPAK